MPIAGCRIVTVCWSVPGVIGWPNSSVAPTVTVLTSEFTPAGAARLQV